MDTTGTTTVTVWFKKLHQTFCHVPSPLSFWLSFTFSPSFTLHPLTGGTTSTGHILWSFSSHLILCSCIDFHRSSGLNLVVIALNRPSGQNKHCTFLTKNGHFSSRERHLETISSLRRGGLLPALSWRFSHMIHSLFELFLLNMLQESGLFCGGEDVRTMVFRLSDTTLPRTVQWVSCFLWMSCQQHMKYITEKQTSNFFFSSLERMRLIQKHRFQLNIVYKFLQLLIEKPHWASHWILSYSVMEITSKWRDIKINNMGLKTLNTLCTLFPCHNMRDITAGKRFSLIWV